MTWPSHKWKKEDIILTYGNINIRYISSKKIGGIVKGSFFKKRILLSFGWSQLTGPLQIWISSSLNFSATMYISFPAKKYIYHFSWRLCTKYRQAKKNRNKLTMNKIYTGYYFVNIFHLVRQIFLSLCWLTDATQQKKTAHETPRSSLTFPIAWSFVVSSPHQNTTQIQIIHDFQRCKSKFTDSVTSPTCVQSNYRSVWNIKS